MLSIILNHRRSNKRKLFSSIFEILDLIQDQTLTAPPFPRSPKFVSPLHIEHLNISFHKHHNSQIELITSEEFHLRRAVVDVGSLWGTMIPHKGVLSQTETFFCDQLNQNVF